MKTITNTRFFSCNSCANRGKTANGQDACGIHKCVIDINNDFCSWHSNQNDNLTCPVCHQSKPVKDFYVYTFNNEIVPICSACSSSVGQCGTCRYNNQCGFATDRSEPQMIMRTVQRGMMTMQTQIKNPNLVIKHCQKCRCSDGANPAVRDIVCFKEQNGTSCPNWQIL